MIIIILINLIMFLMLKKYSKKITTKTKKIFIIGLVIELLLLIVYRIDLFYIGREVYYSDAETYWKHTLELINKGYSSGYNSLYYYVCFLIQKTSPFLWVGWNNIFNITCINFSLVLIMISLIKINESNIKKVNYFLVFTMINPFVVYSLMRNLKDSLFMFMTIVVGYLFVALIEKSKKIKKIIIIGILIIMSYLFVSIRPWAFIIPIIALIYAFIYNLYKKNKKINFKKIVLSIIFALIFIIVICLIFPAIYINIKLWTPIVLKSFFSRSVISNALGIFRFILAPGPVRSFMGHKYFEHYLISGNIMSGIGQIIWWFSMTLMLAAVIKNKFKIEYLKNNLFTIYMITITIIYIIIYVFQYGGIGELRLKAVLFVFIYSIFFGLYDVLSYKENKKMYNLLMFIMTIVFVLVTWVVM